MVPRGLRGLQLMGTSTAEDLYQSEVLLTCQILIKGSSQSKVLKPIMIWDEVYVYRDICVVRYMRGTFAVRETASLGIMGAPQVPPLYRETQSLGQQMLEKTSP